MKMVDVPAVVTAAEDCGDRQRVVLDVFKSDLRASEIKRLQDVNDGYAFTFLRLVDSED